MSRPIIVWFRKDLRLADHPALWHAAEKNVPIIPLYIFDEQDIGEAQKVWLHHSLKNFMKDIPLVLRKGNPVKVLSEIQNETQAEIFTHRCYETHSIEIEKKLSNLTTFNGNHLLDPWDVSPKSSAFFKVFTPFWNTCLKILEPPLPLPVPKFNVYQKKIQCDQLDEWQLLPKHPNWAKGIEAYWKFGEKAANQRLQKFTESALDRYGAHRDMAAEDGTSQLSPYLHFGQISPRQIWHTCQQSRLAEPYIRQLGWREFSYHLLYHFPQLPNAPFKKKFSKFKWNEQPEAFNRWCKGTTGFPIVDAGMRQLWETGWMHNRVRMIVASFLTKDLLIPWQEGAKWFWDTLVDADLANNSAGWQWVAGCGADAAPYFRIFNPVLQGEKFDPEGEYVRRWVPELRDLDKKNIHQPWSISGLEYPDPIVNHKEARDEALKRYDLIK